MPAHPRPGGAARRRPPWWLRRLDLVKAELRGETFPRSTEEGLRLVAALSAIGLRMLRESSGGRDPASLLARLARERERWSACWRRELDRFFRG